MQTIAERLETLPQVGRVEWMGLSPATGAPLRPVTEATLLVGHGLEFDHHAKRRSGTKRQVTLLQHEHLAVVGSVLQRDVVTPQLLRRNIVVSGINLLAMKGKEFAIGDTLLAYSGPCDPCSQMEENLGPGGLNAMRGHGGICAMVLSGGVIKLGDAVRFTGTTRVVQDEEEG
jgi:MOSC domain-containing protein YiiM